MHWSAPFVGLPWREKGRDRGGVDCWGLTALVYAEALSLVLPSYTDNYAGIAEKAEIAALMTADAACWPWQAVDDEARDFDVAMFRRGRMESHVGLVAGPSRMLHIFRGGLSCLESYTDGRWRPRLIGIYRHAEMCTAR